MVAGAGGACIDELPVLPTIGRCAMIVDGRRVARDSVLRCDVCIVGAGPAGLVAANEFLGHAHSVCLVESGGFGHNEATQALAGAEVVDNDDLYPDPLYAHDRRIGGTSVQWT